MMHQKQDITSVTLKMVCKEGRGMVIDLPT